MVHVAKSRLKAIARVFAGATTAVAFTVGALIQGCGEQKNPVSLDSAQGANGNLVVACRGGVNALRGRMPGTSPGVLLVGDTVTTELGQTSQTLVENNDKLAAFTPFPLTSSVLPPMYGTATFGFAGDLDYTPPTSCTGIDSVWYVLTNAAGVRDTGLLVVHVVHPGIAQSDSVDVITQEAITYHGIAAYNAAGTHARAIAFVGSSHGARAIVDSSTIAYVAPSGFAGIDSVRIVFEAMLSFVAFRDTAVVRFNVLPRAAAPGPYDVATIGPSGGALLATGLSTDGKVAGTVTLPSGETHAFKWIGDAFTDLGLYSGASTTGVGINSSGDVAGYATKRDSTVLGLIWKAGGSTVELPRGAPESIGITDDGVVVAGGDYLRNGPTFGSSITALTNSGNVLSCDNGMYPTCELWLPNGRETVLDIGHGTFPVLTNDSSDVWVWGTTGNISYHDVFYERVATNGSNAPRPLAGIFPELVPYGDSTGLAKQERLKLDNRRNLLETNLLVTPRGAFVIDNYIADRTWHLVQATTMNDRGQILGIARNSATGVTTPVLLTPRAAP